MNKERARHLEKAARKAAVAVGCGIDAVEASVSAARVVFGSSNVTANAVQIRRVQELVRDIREEHECSEDEAFARASETVQAQIDEVKVEKFAFVSRHEVAADQIELATKQGIELIPVGDRDAFEFYDPAQEFLRAGFTGVVVVHPLAALVAYQLGLKVGIFNNVYRGTLGEKSKFETTEFRVIDPNYGYHCATCANSLGELCNSHR